MQLDIYHVVFNAPGLILRHNSIPELLNHQSLYRLHREGFTGQVCAFIPSGKYQPCRSLTGRINMMVPVYGFALATSRVTSSYTDYRYHHYPFRIPDNASPVWSA